MPFVHMKNLPQELRAAADLTDIVPDESLAAGAATTTTTTTTTAPATTAMTRPHQVASLEKTTSLTKGESSSNELSSSSIIEWQDGSSFSSSSSASASSSSSSSSSRLTVNTWVSLIQSDAQALWTSPASTEIWTFHGLDPQELGKHWSAYTLVRVSLPLTKWSSLSPAERAHRYARFVERFATVRAARQYAMRVSYFQHDVAAVMRRGENGDDDDDDGVGDAPVGTVCDQLARMTGRHESGVPIHESERDGVVYYVLTQRPDLFIQSSIPSSTASPSPSTLLSSSTPTTLLLSSSR